MVHTANTVHTTHVVRSTVTTLTAYDVLGYTLAASMVLALIYLIGDVRDIYCLLLTIHAVIACVSHSTSQGRGAKGFLLQLQKRSLYH